MAPDPLLQLYYHAVLPRKVPGQAEKPDITYSINRALSDRFIEALKIIAGGIVPEHAVRLDAVRLAVSSSRTLNVERKIDKTCLVQELQQLGGGQTLILHVTEQNASLLIYRLPSFDGEKDEMIFEAFETSATNEAVLASEGALLWDFPGVAVSVADKDHSDEYFQQALAAFLEQVSIESVKRFSAITYKASALLPEIRDTTDPQLITRVLEPILEANGRQYHPVFLQKRVRDTVSFFHAQMPWRRSPFYLFLRVAVARILYRLFGPDVGRVYYKVFMCVFLSRLLDDISGMLLLPPSLKVKEQIASEEVNFLKEKIGRRLAKLESDKTMSCVTYIKFLKTRLSVPDFLSRSDIDWMLYTTTGASPCIWTP